VKFKQPLLESESPIKELEGNDAFQKCCGAVHAIVESIAL
jgi:hypothetical protein